MFSLLVQYNISNIVLKINNFCIGLSANSLFYSILYTLGARQVPSSRLLSSRVLHVFLSAQDSSLLLQAGARRKALLRHQLLQVH